jgi:hypothetical protein
LYIAAVFEQTGAHHAESSVADLPADFLGARSIKSGLDRLDCVGISLLHGGYGQRREARRHGLRRGGDVSQKFSEQLHMHRHILHRALPSKWERQHQVQRRVLECGLPFTPKDSLISVSRLRIG